MRSCIKHFYLCCVFVMFSVVVLRCHITLFLNYLSLKSVLGKIASNRLCMIISYVFQICRSLGCLKKILWGHPKQSKSSKIFSMKSLFKLSIFPSIAAFKWPFWGKGFSRYIWVQYPKQQLLTIHWPRRPGAQCHICSNPRISSDNYSSNYWICAYNNSGD